MAGSDDITHQQILDKIESSNQQLLTALSQQLGKITDSMMTKTDVQEVVREELKGYAKQDDLKAFATKDDLRGFATKDDLKSFATKKDLRGFATKDDLKSFATKDDLRRVIHDEFKPVKEDIKVIKYDLRNLKMDVVGLKSGSVVGGLRGNFT